MAAAFEVVPAFERFLEQERKKDLLRFLTCGSVDDGKSTLIGRLLYDSRNVFEDQVHAAEKASRARTGGGLDLSLITDGLRAEREQGITIDVAYRYFATARRKFILADTPGHEQYTRNMATGASTADLAILLLDARRGVLAQSRRHAYICSLLGIRRFAVAVNKMDLVDYDREVFERLRGEFTQFLDDLGVRDAFFLPVSALAGDNVVRSSDRLSWFDGPSLLEYLETVELGVEASDTGFRMPVQRVIRPDQNFRGYAGTIASGRIRRGDSITVLPSGLRSRVERIVTYDGDLEEAFAPMAVTVTVADNLDVSRGDMLYAGPVRPQAARQFEAQVVWMDSRPLEARRRYLIKHGTQTVIGEVSMIAGSVNIQTLERRPAASLEMNAIGFVEIAAQKPLFFDEYARNRGTGSFILIDPETNATSGAGMILQPAAKKRNTGVVTQAQRIARWGHRGAVIRVRDAAIAHELERRLFEHGCVVAFAGEQDKPEAFERAGILAIVVQPEGARHGDVDDIVRRLELEGILLARDVISGGEGI